MIKDIVNFFVAQPNRSTLSQFTKPGSVGINDKRPAEHTQIMQYASFLSRSPNTPKTDGLMGKIKLLFEVSAHIYDWPDDAAPGLITGPINSQYINAFGAVKTANDLETEVSLINLVNVYWNDNIVHLKNHRRIGKKCWAEDVTKSRKS